MKSLNRRTFMKGTLAAGAAMTLPHSKVRGANDEIRVAVVGINGRGGSHIKSFHKMDGVRVVALCDVDLKVLERRAKPFRDRNEKVDTYTATSCTITGTGSGISAAAIWATRESTRWT